MTSEPYSTPVTFSPGLSGMFINLPSPLPLPSSPQEFNISGPFTHGSQSSVFFTTPQPFTQHANNSSSSQDPTPPPPLPPSSTTISSPASSETPAFYTSCFRLSHNYTQQPPALSWIHHRPPHPLQHLHLFPPPPAPSSLGAQYSPARFHYPFQQQQQPHHINQLHQFQQQDFNNARPNLGASFSPGVQHDHTRMLGSVGSGGGRGGDTGYCGSDVRHQARTHQYPPPLATEARVQRAFPGGTTHYPSPYGTLFPTPLSPPPPSPSIHGQASSHLSSLSSSPIVHHEVPSVFQVPPSPQLISPPPQSQQQQFTHPHPHHHHHHLLQNFDLTSMSDPLPPPPPLVLPNHPPPPPRQPHHHHQQQHQLHSSIQQQQQSFQANIQLLGDPQVSIIRPMPVYATPPHVSMSKQPVTPNPSLPAPGHQQQPVSTAIVPPLVVAERLSATMHTSAAISTILSEPVTMDRISDQAAPELMQSIIIQAPNTYHPGMTSSQQPASGKVSVLKRKPKSLQQTRKSPLKPQLKPLAAAATTTTTTTAAAVCPLPTASSSSVFFAPSAGIDAPAAAGPSSSSSSSKVNKSSSGNSAGSLLVEERWCGDVPIGEQVVEVETDEHATELSKEREKATFKKYMDFVRRFKSHRSQLGYTLTDVIQQVAIRYGQRVSLPYITTFEEMRLPERNFIPLMHLLELWVRDTASAAGLDADSGILQVQVTGIYPQRERKQKHLLTAVRLEDEFSKKKNPSPSDIQRISQMLRMDKMYIRNWFRDRRKREKEEREAMVVGPLLSWSTTQNVITQFGKPKVPSSLYDITVEVPSIHPRDMNLSHSIEV